LEELKDTIHHDSHLRRCVSLPRVQLHDEEEKMGDCVTWC